MHWTTEITIALTSQKLVLHSSISLCCHLRNDWQRLGVVRTNSFLKTHLHSNVSWMHILVGLIPLYSWVLRVSSLSAPLSTACTIQQSVGLAGRWMLSPSLSPRWHVKNTHDRHADCTQQARCFHKIVLLVKNRTTCTSTLRQLYQNLC